MINAHQIAKLNDDHNDPLTSDEDLGHPVDKSIVSYLSDSPADLVTANISDVANYDDPQIEGPENLRQLQENEERKFNAPQTQE